MKKIIIGLFLLILISPVFAKNEVGRFQLFQGYYRSANLNNLTSSDEKDIFKIDTVTGKVWKFVVAVEKDKLLENWLPVPFERK